MRQLRLYHIIDKGGKTLGWVAYKYVSYGANQLAILNDWAAAHTLHNAASFV